MRSQIITTCKMHCEDFLTRLELQKCIFCFAAAFCNKHTQATFWENKAIFKLILHNAYSNYIAACKMHYKQYVNDS